MVKSKQLVKEYIKTIGKYTYDQRDCIGSIWKILEKYGAKTNLVGSNWFARHELRNMRPLTNKNQLYDGCAVLKTILPGEPGYRLPDRYKNHVDLIDYNHIGLGTDDGRILDSTKYGQRPDGSWTRNGPGWSTAKINSRSWDIIADFEDVDYSDRFITLQPGEYEIITGKDDVYMGATAMVTAEKGNTVNLRAAKGTGKTIVREYVPVGTIVQVLKQEDVWSQIQTPAGKTGWMKNEFLTASTTVDTPSGAPDSPQPPILVPGMVQVTLPEGAAMALLEGLKQVFPNA
jgi:hypothetical protein